MSSRKTITLSDPQMDVLETDAQLVLMHSGAGSGKSYDMGILSADFITRNPEVRGFIGANTYGQLTSSTLNRIFNVWQDIYGFVKGIHYVVDHIPPANFTIIGEPFKDYHNKISFNNGGLIFLASLENYSVIDGTEFGWALLDETKDTKEIAVKEVIIFRLREMGMMIDITGKVRKTRKWNKETKQIDDLLKMRLENGTWKFDVAENKYYDENGTELTGYNPLYIFTSPAKEPWLMRWFKLDDYAEEIEKRIYSKTDYFRKRIGNVLVVISSTYHNEINLSPGYIQRRIDDLAGDPGRIKMLIYGSPFGKTGGEYYYGYDRLKNVGEFDPWQDEPVHLSFDFNTKPYMTCTCWQLKYDEVTGTYNVRCFDEFCLPNPKNNTPDICDAVIAKYHTLLKNGVFYYGDYSGKNNQTITKDFKHQYSVIENKFAEYLTNTSDRVILQPRHVKRKPFMNKALAGMMPMTILIHQQCTELRGDFEFVKEGKEGGKLKNMVTGENGDKYEERCHTSDSADYFLCSVFNDLYNK